MSKITIIPPERQTLPVRQDERAPFANGINPGSFISSALTRREAVRHQRVFQALTARTKAEVQLINAQTGAVEAHVRRERAAAALSELPEVLAMERDYRRAERAEELRELHHRHDLGITRRETERLQSEAARIQAQHALDAQERYGHALHEVVWKKQQVVMLDRDVAAAERQHILDEYQDDEGDWDDGADKPDGGDQVLDTLYNARSVLLAHGHDTSAIDESIAQHKRNRGW